MSRSTSPTLAGRTLPASTGAATPVAPAAAPVRRHRLRARLTPTMPPESRPVSAVDALALQLATAALYMRLR